MKIKTNKIVALASATAIIVCAFYAYSVATAHYSYITGINESPIEVANKGQRTPEPEPSMIDYVLNEVQNAGFDKYQVYNLIQCESRWDDTAVGVNYHRQTDTYSIDFGLWQINDFYHAEVPITCSLDYKCATKEAIRILTNRGFTEWSCGK